MTIAASQHGSGNGASVFSLSPDERQREGALREKFASFWATTAGSPREVYDAFISGSPLVEGVGLEAVETKDVRGWWVRPSQPAPGQTPGPTPGQAILFLHGGGYGLGSAAAYRGFVSQIVSRAAVPALVIDYPLAPEATVPAAPDAALAAWRYLVDRGFERIAVVGDSAGGGLALVTLARLTQEPHGPAPVAGAVFSPWTDLAFTGRSMTDASVADPLISFDYLQSCAKAFLGNTDARDPIASPLFGDLRGLPPLLIQVGTDERLLDDARQYAERATRAGVAVQLEVWEGMHHVFQLDVAHLDSSRRALDRTAHVLRDAFAAR